METWFYFWYTNDTDMKTQRELAEKYVPNKRYWLGREAHASHLSARDVTKLIYTKIDDKLARPIAEKPIRPGHKIVVSNLHVLGAQIDTVRQRIQKIHSEGVELEILSLDYHDPMTEEFTKNVGTDMKDHDYRLLVHTLDEIFKYRQKMQSGKQTEKVKVLKKRGRPKRNIHFDMLTRDAQRVLQDFNDGIIERNECYNRLYNKMPDKKSLSKGLFANLIRESKTIYHKS